MTEQQLVSASAPGPVRSHFLPWWRRTYLVNRELQLKFARSALIVGVASSAVSTGLLLWSFYAFNIWQGQRLPTPILMVLGLTFLMNLAGIFLMTILATHKIVGPIFNLLRQFQRLAKADFSALARFRSSDEMHYVARRFNELVMMLRVRNDFIFAKMEEAAQALDAGEPGKARIALEAIREMRERERASELNARQSTKQSENRDGGTTAANSGPNPAQKGD